MAFESKRLRVQLPCGGETVVEHDLMLGQLGLGGLGTQCRMDGSCWGSCYLAGSERPRTVCLHSPVQFMADAAVGPLVVDAAQLPVLRAQLEVQLKEIEGLLKEVDGAERAVEERKAEE